MKILGSVVVSVLFLASQAIASGGPSIQWSVDQKINGVIRGVAHLVTGAEVANSLEYPLGYVADLIGKQDLCFNGSAQDVVAKIIDNGLDTGGDEGCAQGPLVTQDGRILIGECSMETSQTTYSLTIGPCGN